MSHFYTRTAQHHFVEAVASAPEKLAAWFAQSVREFAAFENPDEALWGRRVEREQVEVAEARSDADVTAILRSRNSGMGRVRNSPSLSFEFIQNEIVPERATGTHRRGRRVDWLLRNVEDHVPILAELKLDSDKDPFFALVQLLMYGAMLSTGAQHERLRKHVDKLSQWSNEGDLGARIDLYVVLVDHVHRDSPFTAHAEKVAAKLIGDPRVSTKIRRIACLETARSTGPLEFGSVFSFTATHA